MQSPSPECAHGLSIVLQPFMCILVCWDAGPPCCWWPLKRSGVRGGGRRSRVHQRCRWGIWVAMAATEHTGRVEASFSIKDRIGWVCLASLQRQEQTSPNWAQLAHIDNLMWPPPKGNNKPDCLSKANLLHTAKTCFAEIQCHLPWSLGRIQGACPCSPKEGCVSAQWECSWAIEARLVCIWRQSYDFPSLEFVKSDLDSAVNAEIKSGTFVCDLDSSAAM